MLLRARYGGNKIWFTPEGGIAVHLINNTGTTTTRGYLVSPSASLDLSVELTAVGDPDPCGSFYEDGIANGELAWVVFSGIADIYYVGSTTHGHFARMTVSGDTGNGAGKAISEVKPSPPGVVTEKHFMETGHLLESRTGAGLAKTLIHFN